VTHIPYTKPIHNKMTDAYSNRFLYAKEVARTKRIHRKNLKEMKPTSKSNARVKCDNSAPARHSFLLNNGKRMMLQKEKKKKIERENLQLLRKLAAIKNRKNGETFVPPKRLLPKNRRAEKIKQEQRIRDNLRIMRSIRNQKGVYNVSSWEEDRRKTEKLLSRMKNNPTVGFLSSSTRKKKISEKSKKSTSDKRDNILETSKRSVFAAVNMKSRRNELCYGSSRKVNNHLLKISLTCSPADSSISVNVLDSDAGCRYSMNMKLEDPVHKMDDDEITTILAELGERLTIKDIENGRGVLALEP